MFKAILVPLKLSLGTGTITCLFASPVLAQVTSDGTVNTQVNQNGNITEITGGETRGSNLFHSFQDFSIPTGNEAFFNNANAIENIFSRVTGGNISNINGVIRANGSASLFLINPAGIIFGENARLDIGGSFYGSTASSILFEDGEFSAADLTTPPVLTINAPIGLGFRDNPGDIVNNSVANEGNGLEVSSDETIALIGGNVSFDGGSIFAPGGNVHLGGLTVAGMVDLDENGGLTFPNSIVKGNVSLVNSSQISVLGANEGSIVFDAQNLDLTSSNINAGIASGLGSLDTKAGNIQIIVTESANLTESSIFNIVGEEAIGEGGDINITTDFLSATDGSRIVTFTNGQGNSGDVIIDAGEIISFSQATAVGSQVFPGARGNGGNIEISSSSISIVSLSQLNSASFGQGNSGNIEVNSNEVNIDGAAATVSQITSILSDGAVGNGGEINIQANSLSVTNGGQLIAATDGTGNAGSINLNIRDRLLIDGVGGQDSSGRAFPSAAFSDVGPTAIGNGGNINIQTNSFFATNGGQLVASTFGQGNAGNIRIDAKEEVSFKGIGSNQLSSAAFSRVDSSGIGDGGDIDIIAKQISVTDGAELIAGTRGQGDAGNVNITASELVLFDGVGEAISQGIEREATSGIDTVVEIEAMGNGGDITISTEAIVVANGATIDASIFGQGNSGDIIVNANSVVLKNNSGIFATNESQNGGNINLQVGEDITLRDSSSISARAFNEATGGNLDIDARFIIAFPDGNNDIIASAEQGQGGNININAESLFGIQERPLNDSTNDINASSDFSLDGNIIVTTSGVNPIRGTVELPSNIVVPESTAQQACEANRELAAKNGLTIAGKGGIVPDPASPFNSLNLYSEAKTIPISTIPAPIETSKGKIQPARGIQVTESGEIILTAYRTNNLGDRLPEARNCHKV